MKDSEPPPTPPLINIHVHFFHTAQILKAVKRIERRVTNIESLLSKQQPSGVENTVAPQEPGEANETSPPQNTTSLPEPLPVEGVKTLNALPSSSIIRDNLRPIHVILKKHNSLKNDVKNAGRLASVLACEAVFGPEIMTQCTPLGGNTNLKGLPLKELYTLKKIILHQYPQFWEDVKSFEPTWKKCQIALEHCCSSFRRNTKS